MSDTIDDDDIEPVVEEGDDDDDDDDDDNDSIYNNNMETLDLEGDNDEDDTRSSSSSCSIRSDINRDEDNNDDDNNHNVPENQQQNTPTSSLVVFPRTASKKRKKHQFTYTVKQKIAIANEALRVGNKSATARKYGLSGREIRKWIVDMDELKNKARANPNAKTCNKGRQFENPALENKIMIWFEKMEQKQRGAKIRTRDVIQQALKIDPNFKDGNIKRLTRWVYSFKNRRKSLLMADNNEDNNRIGKRQKQKRDYEDNYSSSVESVASDEEDRDSDDIEEDGDNDDYDDDSSYIVTIDVYGNFDNNDEDDNGSTFSIISNKNESNYNNTPADPSNVVPTGRKKHQFVFTVKQKILISEEALRVGNKSATARKYGISAREIRKWIVDIDELKKKARANPNAKTCGKGKRVENVALEKELLVWMRKRERTTGKKVRTRDISQQAIKIDPNFKDGNMNRIKRWVYTFLNRRNSSILDTNQSDDDDDGCCYIDMVHEDRKGDYDNDTDSSCIGTGDYYDEADNSSSFSITSRDRKNNDKMLRKSLVIIGNNHRKQQQGKTIEMTTATGNDTTITKPRGTPRKRKRHEFVYTVQQKIGIVNEALRVGNKSVTARKYGISSREIRKWVADIDELKTKALANPNAKTCNRGPPVQYAALENELKVWLEKMQHDGTKVRTSDIIQQVIIIDPTFKEGDTKRVGRWVYNFLDRKKPSKTDPINNDDIIDVEKGFSEEEVDTANIDMVDGRGNCDNDNSSHKIEIDNVDGDEDEDDDSNSSKLRIINDDNDNSSNDTPADLSVQVDNVHEQQDTIKTKTIENNDTKIRRNLSSKRQQSGIGEVAVPRKRKKHEFKYTVKQKIKIVNEALEVGNKSATARKHGVSAREIRKWAADIEELKKKASENPNAKTCNKGQRIKYATIENAVKEWLEKMQQEGTPVHTKTIIEQAIKIDPNFYNGDTKRVGRWVYNFMDRNKLSINRRVAHIMGPKPSGNPFKQQANSEEIDMQE